MPGAAAQSAASQPRVVQRAIEGGVGPVLLNAPQPLFDAAEVAPLLRAILTEAGAPRT